MGNSGLLSALYLNDRAGRVHSSNSDQNVSDQD